MREGAWELRGVARTSTTFLLKQKELSRKNLKFQMFIMLAEGSMGTEVCFVQCAAC